MKTARTSKTFEAAFTISSDLSLALAPACRRIETIMSDLDKANAEAAHDETPVVPFRDICPTGRLSLNTPQGAARGRDDRAFGHDFAATEDR
jgi:hypothetical protein